MSESNALMIVSKAIQAPQMRDQFQQMLPKDVPVDRFTEVALMAVRSKPELLDADRQTLYDSCLVLARRGLLPDGKESALVVFSTKVGNNWVKKCQAMPMVEGIIKEMGKVGVKAYATSVYEHDSIEFWNDDDGQHVLHKPKVFGDRGRRLGAFTAAKMPDGRTYVEAMNMDDLERIALRSKQARDNNGQKSRGGTWASDPERMEQKTCLHRVRKRMPIAYDDDGVDLSERVDPETGEIQPTPAAAPPQNEPSCSPQNMPEGESGGIAEGASVPSVSMTEVLPAEQPARRTRRPSSLKSVIEQAKSSPTADQFRDGDII